MEADGNWSKVDEKRVILNSRYDIRNLPIDVFESSLNVDDKQISIIPKGDFFTTSSHNLLFYVIINGQIEAIMKGDNIRDVILTNNQNVDSLQVEVFYDFFDYPLLTVTNKKLSSIVYIPENPAFNYFRIEFPLDVEMFFFKTIKADTLLIERNKLFWLDKKFKKIH